MRLAQRFSLLFLASAFSLPLVACGGGGDDGGDDDTGPPEGDHHQFVVSALELPTKTGDGDRLGVDLNDDGVVDNALGGILTGLASQAPGLNLQASLDKEVQVGNVILLADVQATDLTAAARVGLTVHVGKDPNPAACTDPNDEATCGKHLQGGASFSLADEGTPGTLSGKIIGGDYTGGPGRLSLALALEGAIIKLNLVGAHAELTGVTADGFTGKVAGAITKGEIDSQVIPAIYQTVTTVVARDCPNPEAADCGCVDGGSGGAVLMIFDKDPSTGPGDPVGNCVISEEEVRNSQILTQLLDPDVDMEEPLDGTPDSLSVGVGVTTVKATWQ